MITSEETITLADVIAISIKNIGTDSVYYGWNTEASVNDPLLTGQEDPWSCEQGGTFKGQKINIKFGGTTNPKCILKILTRGPEIPENEC